MMAAKTDTAAAALNYGDVRFGTLGDKLDTERLALERVKIYAQKVLNGTADNAPRVTIAGADWHDGTRHVEAAINSLFKEVLPRLVQDAVAAQERVVQAAHDELKAMVSASPAIRKSGDG